jgi:CheY-like chemotaxis protein
MPPLQWRTETRVVSTLIPNDKNPRVMSPKQIEDLKKSLKKFNLVEIPVIDTDNRVIAGHQRLMVLKLLGREREKIEVRVPNRKLTKQEYDQYLLASNRILIVEDDPLLVRIYSVRLKEEGFDVDVASDGNEAMENVKKQAPDLILLDLLMPRRDGFAFLDDLKALGLNPKPPVVVLTNLDKPDDAAKAKQMGADDYVVKGDTNMDAIIAKIKAFEH